MFGSALPAADQPLYAVAFRLGTLLTQAGYAVCSGGYDGTMAAVSKAARQAGGHVTGVTMEGFGPRTGNPWLDEEVRTATLLHRLEHLVQRGDGFIALPGGPGTLAEIALVWALRCIAEVEKPLILIGDEWSAIVASWRDHLLTRPRDWESLEVVDTPERAVERMSTLLPA